MLGVDLGDVMEFQCSEKGGNIIYSQEFVCLQTNGLVCLDRVRLDRGELHA